MAVFGALVHFLGLFAPALGVSLIVVGLSKGLWRGELAGVAWTRLYGACAAAQCLALLAGLVLFGRDGKMVTYGAMVLSGVTALWWVGFAARR